MSIRDRSPFLGMILPNGLTSIATNGDHVLSVSVCFFINKFFAGFDTAGKTVQAIEAQYQQFYDRVHLINKLLYTKSTSLTITASFGSDPNPVVFTPLPDETGKELRDLLWDALFPSTYNTVTASGQTVAAQKEVDASSRVKAVDPGQISNLFDEPRLLFSNTAFLKVLEAIPSDRGLLLTQLLNDFDPFGKDHPLAQQLEKFVEHSKANSKLALLDLYSFIARYNPEALTVLDNIQTAERINRTEATQAVGILQDTRKLYVSNLQSKIDVDEIIHSFSALSNEPALMRIAGLVRDFNITLPKRLLNRFPINFKLSFSVANPTWPLVPPQTGAVSNIQTDILIRPTSIRGVEHAGMFAYLVDKKPVVKKTRRELNKKSADTSTETNAEDYYSNSLLRADGARLIRYDKMAQEFANASAVKKYLEGELNLQAAIAESLTRGILYTNSNLPAIIKPAEIPDIDDGLKTFIYSEDYLTRGHRVAAVINKKEFYSITSRRLELKLPGSHEPFLIKDHHEGCIHFDAPTAYMENGKVKSQTSDVLFVYPGELLKLKSVFSRATFRSKAEKAQYAHDDGMHKSVERFKQVLAFLRFPDAKIDPKEVPNTVKLICTYNFPAYFTKSRSPKLRFTKFDKGPWYTFVISCEYLNGWGLPMKAARKFDRQLSLEDVVGLETLEKVSPEPILFSPLENKKPVQLFHRAEVKEDESIPIEARQALESLVVRNDVNETGSSRHVLPERIAFEHAHWYDLFTDLPVEDSNRWRNKYNCPFTDRENYDAEVKNYPGGCCPQDCHKFCEATTMAAFYPDEHITPNYIADPSVIGFEAKFYWDKDCTLRIATKQVICKFGGKRGLAPESYRLELPAGFDKFDVRNNEPNQVLEVFLKKGMHVYAEFSNLIAPEYAHQLKDAWWRDQGFQLPDDLFAGDYQNGFKRVSMIRAVNEPVIKPSIVHFYSTPANAYQYSHVDKWTAIKYKDFSIARGNIVVSRVATHDGDERQASTKIETNFVAQFERLDAYELYNRNNVRFLPGVTPTGTLELWMRKEEYVDDPNEFVKDPGATGPNHSPERPVVEFSSDENIPFLEHRIEFDNDVLYQLKLASNNHALLKNDDLYRDVESGATLRFDCKSTKFEERRYRLRNGSKYKSYFSGGKEEDFYRESDEFAVLVLNNNPPAKPDVAFAITTISAERKKEHDKVTKSQRGNIVTVYLKRGRLTSGKDERVGVVINDGSPYSRAFLANNFVSKVGSDIVSDAFSPGTDLLVPANIKYQFGDDSENEYEAMYEPDLGLGLVHYLPKFDIEKQLWKFEVEFDIGVPDTDPNKALKRLHNPFVNLALVHYQPLSVNYNGNTTNLTLDDIKKDCRLSVVEMAVWCYLLPDRSVSVYFDKPGHSWWPWGHSFGEVSLTVTYDYESLHHSAMFVPPNNEKPLLRSNFIMSVEGSNDGVAWYPMASQVLTPWDNKPWQFMHPVLSEDKTEIKSGKAERTIRFSRVSVPDEAIAQGLKAHPTKFSRFRVRFLEVEWFTQEEWKDIYAANMDLMKNEMLENEGFRVRYVELFY